MQQRIGIIDLGSNTARLIVLAYRPAQTFALVDEVSERVRLVEGVGSDGRLQREPMRRAVETMQMFSAFCRAADVPQVVAVATSAVREATNQAAFLDEVRRESGLTLRVLSGEEEAYYGYLGVANTLLIDDGCVVDIGGGSTEVTGVRGGARWKSSSYPAGVVRFSERFIHSDPIASHDYQALEAAAAAAFAGIAWLDGYAGATLVGVGGTARKLARMHQRARGYPLDRIHGYSFGRADLDAMVDQLRGMNQREREQTLGLGRNRADVILAGAVLMQQLMQRGRFEQLQVSGWGLREGLFFEHFLADQQRPVFDDMRAFSVYNVAQRYHFEPQHVARVRELSLSLFDQLAPLHGYGAWERELLAYAAVLHDIGVTVEYYNHHEHSAYLVMHSPLQGFSHREIVLLAQLTRLHRKGNLEPGPFDSVLDDSDGARLERLSALLRIATGLERSKSQVVRSLRVRLGDDAVQVLVQTSGDAALELWNANRSSGLFARAFGRSITLSSE